MTSPAGLQDGCYHSITILVFTPVNLPVISNIPLMMTAFYHYLNELVNSNKQLYSAYPDLNWMNPYTAYELLEKRNLLVDETRTQSYFKETKPYHRSLSPGCALCGQGQWSCLFITGKCNASCFYCPADQSKDDWPTTQQLKFKTPEAYAEYVHHFNFKGVSFSGGEPLLVFDRVLEYLKAVRTHCSEDIYTWMYTNGLLADAKKFMKLNEAGLNEVRFDIGATGYQLDKVKLASGIIKNITIEIPAVPEEKERLMALLPQMIEAGVTNLNLHQLRLTPYNAPKLSKRDYTYISAERPIVLESEITALEIIDYARRQNLEIGINYCSFFFKYRFQKAGYRKQVATSLGYSPDSITEKGYIRQFNGSELTYQGVLLNDAPTDENDERELQLKHKTYYIKDALACQPIKLLNGAREGIEQLMQNTSGKVPEDAELFKIWQHECIEKGLREL